jgi:hypothetical protein
MKGHAMRALRLILCCGLVLAPVAAQAAAPAALHGKSVVISMSETRTSRRVSGGPTTNSSASMKFSVYISTAGRPFVRSKRVLTTRKRGTETKAIDAAPGGNIGVSTASNVSFSGNSMVVIMAMTSGARRITVNFNGGSSCSATVVHGKEGGKNMVIRSRYTGVQREVLSSEIAVNSCSVTNGNVFGGGAE